MMPFLCRGRFVNITMKIAVDVVPDMMMISVMMIVMLLMMMVLIMVMHKAALNHQRPSGAGLCGFTTSHCLSLEATGDRKTWT